MGPNVKPWCAWPNANHMFAWCGAGPMIGSMSGVQGACAHPGFRIHTFGQREELAGDGLDGVELHGRLRSIAVCEFRARRQPDAARHRCQHITAVCIEHGMVQLRTLRGCVVHVVPALDGQRQAVAQARGEDVRPGAHGDDDVVCAQLAFLGLQQPRGVRRERVGIGFKQAAAELLEIPCVGRDQRVRVAHGIGFCITQAAEQRCVQMRFNAAQARWVQRFKGDAVFALPALDVARFLVLRGGIAEDLDPAAGADQMRGAGGFGQSAVLAHAVRDQRRIRPRNRRVPRGVRVAPVLPQKRQQPGQVARVVMHVRRRVARITQQCRQVARERIRIHTLALNQPGIAERRLKARRTAVDKRDGAPAFLQMHRHRYADNAGAQHKGVKAHGGWLLNLWPAP